MNRRCILRRKNRRAPAPWVSVLSQECARTVQSTHARTATYLEPHGSTIPDSVAGFDGRRWRHSGLSRAFMSIIAKHIAGVRGSETKAMTARAAALRAEGVDHHAESGRARLRDAGARSRGGISTRSTKVYALHRRSRHSPFEKRSSRSSRRDNGLHVDRGPNRRRLRSKAGDFQRAVREPRSWRRSRDSGAMLGVLSGNGPPRGRNRRLLFRPSRRIQAHGRGARACTDASAQSG